MAPRPVPLSRSRWSAARQRVSWLLLLSLLPTLTFAGHWSIELTVPGKGLRLELPMAEAAHEHDGHGQHSHADHCHADAASCSDVPLTSLASVALLHETIAFVTAGGRLELMVSGYWQPSHSEIVTPETTPPRFAI